MSNKKKSAQIFVLVHSNLQEILCACVFDRVCMFVCARGTGRAALSAWFPWFVFGGGAASPTSRPQHLPFVPASTPSPHDQTQAVGSLSLSLFLSSVYRLA